MAGIDEGTQFIGIPKGVPIPENKSAQNNSFQEVYTLADISNSAKNGSVEDFFVFSGAIISIGGPSYKLLFKKTGEIVNEYPEWSYYDKANDNMYFIRINGDQTIWKLYQNNADIATIEDVQGEVPPSGDWDFDGDIIAITISYVSGSIQQVIEGFAFITF